MARSLSRDLTEREECHSHKNSKSEVEEEGESKGEEGKAVLSLAHIPLPVPLSLVHTPPELPPLPPLHDDSSLDSECRHRDSDSLPRHSHSSSEDSELELGRPRDLSFDSLISGEELLCSPPSLLSEGDSRSSSQGVASFASSGSAGDSSSEFSCQIRIRELP
jgi:hypothetical protein